MTAPSLCWINNAIKPTRDCHVSVLDHGLLYGDGIFEGCRFYHRQVLHLPRHLKRLQDSAQAIQLNLPYSLAEIEQAIRQLITAYGEESGYLRLVVTRGEGNLGLNPKHCPRGNLFIIADQLSLASSSARQQGLTMITSSIRRTTGTGLDSRVKSLNYLHSVLARMEANAAGVDEALLLNERGMVAEATAENVFIELNGELITPPVTDGALGGITRATVIELAAQSGFKVIERSITTYDIYTADACFLTGSGAGLLPVKELDSRQLRSPRGDIFGHLESALTRYIAEQCPAGMMS